MYSTLPQQHRPGLEAQHKILLVDDDAVSLEILALLLGFDGHEVVRASDGESALALLVHPDSSMPPDVLLVDMQMPGLSGYQLVERIRAMGGPTPLLLGMSATNLTAPQMSGFDGFLRKPLDLDDLRTALEPLNAAGPEQRGTFATGTDRGPRAKSAAHGPAPQVSASRQGQAINVDILDKLRSSMPSESLKQLYAACLEDSRKRATVIRMHIEAARTAETRREAHQIKGAASMIGAERVAHLASSLESGSGDKEDSLILLTDLLSACDELERILLAGKIDKSI